MGNLLDELWTEIILYLPNFNIKCEYFYRIVKKYKISGLNLIMLLITN